MAELTSIRVIGDERLADLVRDLEAAGRGDLQRDLTSELRAAAQPPLRAVRAAWMGIEVRSSGPGGKSSGLRGRVAGATDVEVNGLELRYSVDGDQVDPKFGRSLTYYLNGTGRWRHPTFGRKPFVQQYGTEVFRSTLLAQEPVWRAGVERAMDRTARKLEG